MKMEEDEVEGRPEGPVCQSATPSLAEQGAAFSSQVTQGH